MLRRRTATATLGFSHRHWKPAHGPQTRRAARAMARRLLRPGPRADGRGNRADDRHHRAGIAAACGHCSAGGSSSRPRPAANARDAGRSHDARRPGRRARTALFRPRRSRPYSPMAQSPRRRPCRCCRCASRRGSSATAASSRRGRPTAASHSRPTANSWHSDRACSTPRRAISTRPMRTAATPSTNSRSRPTARGSTAVSAQSPPSRGTVTRWRSATCPAGGNSPRPR